MPVNFPGSLDSAVHPGPGTYRDDPGFNLSLMVSNLWDAVVALENKVAIGASTPSGATNTVLRRTAANASAWGQLQTADIATGGQVSKVQLNYNLAADASNVPMSAGAWTNTVLVQTFNVDDANSIIEVYVRGHIAIQCATANNNIGSRIIIQSATGYGPLGGMIINTVNGWGNPIAGANMLTIPNPGVGTFQINVQVWSSNAAIFNILAASLPGIQGLGILVVERKR
jgi:hypothetical protein